MTRQVEVESPGINRRQPLLPPTGDNRMGEVVGGTAAECAAVCCCCPCALMNLLILAVFRLPTGLCKKAWKKKKRRGLIKKKNKKKKKKSGPTIISVSDVSDVEESDGMNGGDRDAVVAETEEAVDMEGEMWDRFYRAGFWRSPSQSPSQRGD